MTTACDGDVEVTAEYPSHGKNRESTPPGVKFISCPIRHSALDPRPNTPRSLILVSRKGGMHSTREEAMVVAKINKKRRQAAAGLANIPSLPPPLR